MTKQTRLTQCSANFKQTRQLARARATTFTTLRQPGWEETTNSNKKTNYLQGGVGFKKLYMEGGRTVLENGFLFFVSAVCVGKEACPTPTI
jgi:hypothetical protein